MRENHSEDNCDMSFLSGDLNKIFSWFGCKAKRMTGQIMGQVSLGKAMKVVSAFNVFPSLKSVSLKNVSLKSLKNVDLPQPVFKGGNGQMSLSERTFTDFIKAVEKKNYQEAKRQIEVFFSVVPAVSEEGGMDFLRMLLSEDNLGMIEPGGLTFGKFSSGQTLLEEGADYSGQLMILIKGEAGVSSKIHLSMGLPLPPCLINHMLKKVSGGDKLDSGVIESVSLVNIISFLTEKPVEASVRAKVDVEVLVLGKTLFYKIFPPNSAVTNQLYALSLESARNIEQKLKNPPSMVFCAVDTVARMIGDAARGVGREKVATAVDEKNQLLRQADALLRDGKKAEASGMLVQAASGYKATKPGLAVTLCKSALELDPLNAEATTVLQSIISTDEMAETKMKKKRFLEYLSQGDFIDMFGKTAIKHFMAGDAVVREGEVGTAMYLIEDGEIEFFSNIAMEGSADKVSYGGLGRGEVFGEIALLQSGIRSATGIVKTDNAYLREIDKDYFEALIENNPRFAYYITELAEERKNRYIDFITQFIDVLAEKEICSADGTCQVPD
ncbi:MAG: cyclic nucleotide-binding domain-containing protein [Nitrospirae bacterium]|nr:cyclic nucleotide-binding domain-containing protein [Nitrospirota bacterium]